MEYINTEKGPIAVDKPDLIVARPIVQVPVLKALEGMPPWVEEKVKAIVEKEGPRRIVAPWVPEETGY